MKRIWTLKGGYGIIVCRGCGGVYVFEGKDVFANINPSLVDVRELSESDITECKDLTVYCNTCYRKNEISLDGVLYSLKYKREDFLKEVLKSSKPKLFNKLEQLEEDYED